MKSFIIVIMLTSVDLCVWTTECVYVYVITMFGQMAQTKSYDEQEVKKNPYKTAKGKLPVAKTKTTKRKIFFIVFNKATKKGTSMYEIHETNRRNATQNEMECMIRLWTNVKSQTNPPRLMRTIHKNGIVLIFFEKRRVSQYRVVLGPHTIFKSMAQKFYLRLPFPYISFALSNTMYAKLKNSKRVFEHVADILPSLHFVCMNVHTKLPSFNRK